MRIEKINERQIRCTLNKKDLQDREIGISELVYGTAKAKALFRDMMQQASFELGFDADNIPLMIEAVPLSSDSLVLIITKVEEPDELDTRFSNFTENNDFEYVDDDLYNDDDDDEIELLDSKGELLSSDKLWSSDNSVSDIEATTTPRDDDFISLPEALGMTRPPAATEEATFKDIFVVFSFSSLDEVSLLSAQINPIYHGKNTLYKDEKNKRFYLVLHRSKNEAEDFGVICNILHEYGLKERNSNTSESYYEEHFLSYIRHNAVAVLADLS